MREPYDAKGRYWDVTRRRGKYIVRDVPIASNGEKLFSCVKRSFKDVSYEVRKFDLMFGKPVERRK